MSSPIIVFGPTGQVGSIAAHTAASSPLGPSNVHLAMRDPSKPLPPILNSSSISFPRIKADLSDPESVREAVLATKAKRAFVYLVHGLTDNMKGTITAMKSAGIEFVVFLSSFTVHVDKPLKEMPASDILASIHGQVEANLEEIFGPGNYAALRPGCFATNLRAEKDAIASGRGELRLYGDKFQTDNIHPGDIGRVAGSVLLLGKTKGQDDAVYIYGPEIMTMQEAYERVGKAVGGGKEITKVTVLSPEEGYEKFTKDQKLPPPLAKYFVEISAGKGNDKGNGEVRPRYEEGVMNVKLYTGKEAIGLEEWVGENKGLFGGVE